MSASALPASDLWRLGAVDLAGHLRAGTVSCVDVLESFYRRTDEVNPRLNAVVHADRERAFRQARNTDAMRIRTPDRIGPLHGVPVTIKLNADVAGEATSNGVPAWSERIAAEDSAVVANLRRAGAIIAGRTNVPPFSFRWFTENPLHGRTLNPWNEAVTSGGSSGGAAVAVASGMCALAHGTDIAGSIRYPAYVNGVVGLRPTPGRVPAVNPSHGSRYAGLQLFSAQGPLARRVDDVELALRVMSTGAIDDATWVPVPLDFPDDAAPVRVACVDAIAGVEIGADTRAALEQAARALEAAGYEVEAATPPSLQDAVEVWLAIVMTEVRLGMMAEVEATQDASIRSAVQAMVDCAPPADLPSYAGALARRDGLRRAWNRFLARHPLILLPTSCRPPMHWGDDLQGAEPMRKLLADQSTLIAVAALGLPAMHVPTGIAQGLPTGVQLVAGSFREQRLVAAARIIERHAQLPPVWEAGAARQS
jgi:amidase